MVAWRCTFAHHTATLHTATQRTAHIHPSIVSPQQGVCSLFSSLLALWVTCALVAFAQVHWRCCCWTGQGGPEIVDRETWRGTATRQGSPHGLDPALFFFTFSLTFLSSSFCSLCSLPSPFAPFAPSLSTPSSPFPSFLSSIMLIKEYRITNNCTNAEYQVQGMGPSLLPSTYTTITTTPRSSPCLRDEQTPCSETHRHLPLLFALIFLGCSIVQCRRDVKGRERWR